MRTFCSRLRLLRSWLRHWKLLFRTEERAEVVAQQASSQFGTIAMWWGAFVKTAPLLHAHCVTKRAQLVELGVRLLRDDWRRRLGR
jgi:hypothetical protein